MSTAYRRMRRQMPWLTPTYAGDDDVPVLRRPPPLDDIDRIAELGSLRRLPAPVPVESPLPEYDPYVAPPTAPPLQLPQMSAPPAMVLSRQGRPQDVVAEGDDYDRALIKRRALEQYQPQKESKKSLLLRTLLGQLRGGLIGEGGSLDTLLGPAGVLDRRGKDRAWQQGQLAQTDEQLGRLRTDRRQTLQDDYLQSQIDENKAQAAKAMQPPPVKPPPLARRIPPVKQVDEAGNEYLADADTGEPLLDAKGNLRYTGRAKVPPVKPDTSEFTNEQIERTIGEIEREQKTLGPSPPTEIADTNQHGEVIGKKTNPAYLDWARRYRELDDQKRQLRVKMKPPAVRATTATTPARTSGITEQAIRDAAKAKNLDPDQAVKRARARGMIR